MFQEEFLLQEFQYFAVYQANYQILYELQNLFNKINSNERFILYAVISSLSLIIVHIAVPFAEG